MLASGVVELRSPDLKPTTLPVMVPGGTTGAVEPPEEAPLPQAASASIRTRSVKTEYRRITDLTPSTAVQFP